MSRDKNPCLGHRREENCSTLGFTDTASNLSFTGRGDEHGNPALGLSPWVLGNRQLRQYAAIMQTLILAPKERGPGVQVCVDMLPLGGTTDSFYQGHRLTWRIVICTYSKLFLMAAMSLSNAEHTTFHVCLLLGQWPIKRVTYSIGI